MAAEREADFEAKSKLEEAKRVKCDYSPNRIKLNKVDIGMDSQGSSRETIWTIFGAQAAPTTSRGRYPLL